jgi:hypothetical protein
VSLVWGLRIFGGEVNASGFCCPNKTTPTSRPKISLGGGEVVPVTVQGNCSYSVYAGPESEFVIQFRLKSLIIRSDIVTLAREIYGSLVPNASFHGQLGEMAKNPYLSML